MRNKLGVLVFFLLTFSTISAQDERWLEMVTLDGKEIYIDTTTVERKETEVTVWVKEIYTKEPQKQQYLTRLQNAMSQTPSDKKSWDKKWSKKLLGLSYTLSKRVYDCVNSEFQVLEISEYTSDGKRILKTTTKKKKAPWRSIEYDTIGDVLMFEVCDNY